VQRGVCVTVAHATDARQTQHYKCYICHSDWSKAEAETKSKTNTKATAKYGTVAVN